MAHCRTMLAKYKIPREVRFEALPRTATGEIQKFQLRRKASSVEAG